MIRPTADRPASHAAGATTGADRLRVGLNALDRRRAGGPPDTSVGAQNAVYPLSALTQSPIPLQDAHRPAPAAPSVAGGSRTARETPPPADRRANIPPVSPHRPHQTERYAVLLRQS